MPIRLKAIHVINTFPLINQIMSLVKPLMKQELFSIVSKKLKKKNFYLSHFYYYFLFFQLHFYNPSDFDIFCEKVISKDNLPSDYGGKLDSLEKLHGEFIF